MKKVLLASTALFMSAGFAAADVSVGGDGRMGVISPFGFFDANDDVTFTSRIRISFSASGETDAGLAFGGSVRADNSEDGTAGQAGSVFIEGGFGKLSMGDVDGAANAAVGHVSGVGLTGLGDFNEILYIANVGTDTPGALYEYGFGDFAFYVSADAPGVDTGTGDNNSWAIGGSYSFQNFTIAAGYEDADQARIEVGEDGEIIDIDVEVPAEHWVIGLTGAFGDFTGKFVYGGGEADNSIDIEQYALSGDYTFGATTLTAFYRMTELEGVAEIEAYGIGAAYDLGGGASLVGGWTDAELTDVAAGVSESADSFDFGISFSF